MAILLWFGHNDSVHMMNVEHRPVAVNLQAQPIQLNWESTIRLLCSTPTNPPSPFIVTNSVCQSINDVHPVPRAVSPGISQWFSLTSMNVLQIRNWRRLLHRCWADAACPVTRWQHFSAQNDRWWPPTWNYDLKLKKTSQSIDVYLREEYTVCQISARSNLKWWRFGLFGRGCPNSNKKKILRSVPDIKSHI